MGRSSCQSTATATASLLLLLCVVSFLAELVVVVHGGLVPALYVLGDSQADVGNNNHLVLSTARADFPRNGIDYPGQQATGRFSNGYNFVDILAESLGLASPPPYHSIDHTAAGSYSASIYLNGINFASGGAGVSELTNKGQCYSFEDQIGVDYSSVHSELVRQLGGQAQATAHLSKSIFVVAIGGNDIILRAMAAPVAVDLTVAAISISSQQFISSLAQTLQGQLQRLYDLGMRRLFFVGAAPIGCVPLMRELSLSRLTTGGCHVGANDMSVRYNAAVASLLAEMSTRHQDLRYAFFDSYAALMRYIDEPEANGYAEVTAACCGLGDRNAMYRCVRVSAVCANRTDHMFWDLVHPTETTSRKMTGVAFDGAPPLVSPINVRKLAVALWQRRVDDDDNQQQQFIDSLALAERLYELGMRRLFFVGTGPLECYPLLRQRSVTKECNAEVNSLSESGRRNSKLSAHAYTTIYVL